ncbi:S-adenosylmethionine decarboxylase [Candidatus Falkowbacteria bacterium]|nr:S-adenosylmethionine decarboxylase [Candidatus Falkowbacteria bacterium]
MTKDELTIKKYKSENPWGMSIYVDLKECNLATMTNAEKIKRFVAGLCDIINVKKFGDTVIVNFGENQRVFGFSMMQLIETSLISGHFANESRAIYLDIFSCKEYPPYAAAEFCKKFFEAKSMEIKINFRY